MGMIHKGDDASENESIYDLPKPEECMTHLKLMLAFSYLKQDISEMKDLFFKDSDLLESSNEDIAATIRDKRWTIYVSRAVKRFKQWAIFRTTQHSSADSNLIPNERDLQIPLKTTFWTENNLPPLDVLMVFHTYMLNPRWFLDDCLRLRWGDLYKAGMPWDFLDQCIDNGTLIYDPSESAKVNFCQTGLHWDNLNDQDAGLMHCQICSADTGKKPQTSNEIWLTHPDFSLLCALPCHLPEHLHQIQMNQLRSELEKFDKNGFPLRATYLNERGRIPGQENVKKVPRYFAARILSIKSIKSHLDQKAHSSSEKISTSDLITSIFDQAETTYLTSTGSTVRSLLKFQPPNITPPERYSLNRTRIAYTEHTSTFPFSINLTTAVLRQGKFVQEMHDLAWHFSPNLKRTVTHILGKYEIFLEIMRTSSREDISVPTLAVDLAWHTHQLDPVRYWRYCVAHVNGMLVDHDDRVGQGDLDRAFKRTSERFDELIGATGGSAYGECLCWVCAARDIHFREMMSDDEAQSLSEDVRKEKLEMQLKETVSQCQLRKFEHDFERSRRGGSETSKGIDNVEERSKFLHIYKWPYPNHIPDVTI